MTISWSGVALIILEGCVAFFLEVVALEGSISIHAEIAEADDECV